MRWFGLVLTLVACGSPANSEAPPANSEAPPAPSVAEAEPAEAEPAAAAEWSHHGAPFSVAEALPASTVMADPASHEAAPVRMRGELTQVCQKMGCWAVVKDDAGNAMRITMKDHAFGIGKQTVGHACDVEGQLVRKQVDPERLAHYASEGATDHPEAGRKEAWEIVATTVATRAPN